LTLLGSYLLVRPKTMAKKNGAYKYSQ